MHVRTIDFQVSSFYPRVTEGYGFYFCSIDTVDGNSTIPWWEKVYIVMFVKFRFFFRKVHRSSNKKLEIAEIIEFFKFIRTL